MPWNDAARIVGGEAALMKLLGLGPRTRKSTLSRHRTSGVPIQNIGAPIYDVAMGKLPRITEEPTELRRALRLLRELYGKTRGTGPTWAAVMQHVMASLDALPKVGERYRPFESPPRDTHRADQA